MQSQNLLYYSTNTQLAHHIGNRFYGGVHYVWCSPVFDPRKSSRYSLSAGIGTTSSPHDIYRDLKKVIDSRDRHSSKIQENKRGLKLGAAKQWEAGKITEEQFGQIIHIIDRAETVDFTPFIYLIRKDLVESRVKEVDVRETANPFGQEFQIFDLESSEFEIIEVELI
jgi:hypothetical protein